MAKKKSAQSLKKEFSALERGYEAKRLGITVFQDDAQRAEERLFKRALAANKTRGAFAKAVTHCFIASKRDRRLLEKFYTFPRSVQREAPWVLALFLEDASAQRLLLALARETPAERFESYALYLGCYGGKGVRALLLQRVREASAALERAETIKLRRRLAVTCTEVAGGLLRLDPDATEAAELLLRIHENPKRYGKTPNGVAFLRDAVDRHPMSGTIAAGRIREALRKLLEPGADEEDFAMAAMALSRIDMATTLQRAAASLFSTDWFVRLLSAQELSTLAPNGAESLLLRYLAKHPDDCDVVRFARRLGTRVPPTLRCTIAERQLADESARSRLAAAEYLLEIPGPNATALARRAARTEPDRLIAHLLQKRAARPVHGD